MKEKNIMYEEKERASMPEYGDAQTILRGLVEAGPKEKARRIDLLRVVANKARDDSRARAYIEKLLSAVERDVPEYAETFRAVYLDGEKRLSAYKISESRHIDAHSIFNHTRRVFEEMLPVAFGIYGVFLTDEERAIAAETAEEIKAIEEKELHPEKAVFCPHCGTPLELTEHGNSYEITCQTDGCLKTCVRGI